MNSLILFNNKLSTIDKTIVGNKEWPFAGYIEEILNLSKYLGIKQYVATTSSNGANSLIRIPAAIVSIDSTYINRSDKKPLYPHSLFFSDGSAINFNEIIYLGLEDKLRGNLTKITPFISALEKDISVIDSLNSPDITYRNMHLYAEQIIDSEKTQKMILNMAQHARDLGMFD